jgi:signal transduction histidine kinase/integral membrane sensor domain MASE1
MKLSSLSSVILIPIVAVIYFAAARLGLSLAYVADQVSVVWPATGIALTAVIFLGVRVWPGILAGAFVANLMTQVPPLVAFAIASGNTLEALTGAWLLQQTGFRPNLERVGDVVRLIGFAGFLSTITSATIGVASLILGGMQPWSAFGSLWMVWWLGDAMGNLIVAPLLLTSPKLIRRPYRWSLPAERMVLIVTTVIFSTVVFAGGFERIGLAYALEYTIFPLVIWAAVRFGPAMTALVTVIASGIAIQGTLNDFGPFATWSTQESLMLLQSFMGIVALTGLILAAITCERRTAERHRSISHAVTDISAGASRPSDAAPRLLETISKHVGWDCGALWMVDQEAGMLRCLDTWCDPDGPITEFAEVTRRINSTRGTGLPGRVWISGKPTWVREVQADPHFLRKPAALKAGLHSAFAFPIHLRGSLIGVIEFFSRKPQDPDPELLSVLSGLGKPIGLFLERKEAEDEMRRSEERYRSFIQNSTGGIWRVEFHTPILVDGAIESVVEAVVTHGYVAEANESMARMYGYSAASMRGVPLAAILPEDDPTARTQLESFVRSGFQLHDAPCRIEAQQGPIEIKRSLNGIVEGERLVRIWGHQRDVTEEYRAAAEREGLLERERAAREEAERASRMKDDFLATISHELRTPLQAILGWSRLLASGELSPEDARRAVEVIDRNAGNQAQLIEDLLDMSRIVSGKLELRREPVRMTAVVDAAIETILPAAKARGISLTVAPAVGDDLVSADAYRMQQVIWNLLSNAVKFTPRGGRVEVFVERRHASLEVRIVDNGQGIPTDFLPFVFDRFRQADGSITRDKGGLGLGLAIVRNIVERHGGRVWVMSSGEGQGSTFGIMLPGASAPGDALSSVDGQEDGHEDGRPWPELAGVRVLVVDDEPDARLLIGHILARCSASAVLVGSVSEALEQIRDHRPDVVVSDIAMPGRDGLEFMREVRNGGIAIPAIALTAFARDEDRQRTIQAGFQAHLAKPVDPLELVSAISVVLASPPGVS